MTALAKIIQARQELRKIHDLLGEPPAAGWDATPDMPMDVAPPAPLDTSQQVNYAMATISTAPAIKLDMSKAAPEGVTERKARSLPTVTDVDGDTFQVPSSYVLIGVDETVEWPPGSGNMTTATEHGGGTLIAPQWVVTAAHVVCSVDADTGEVYSKADALRLSVAPAGRNEHTEQFTCTEVYVHAYYDAGLSSYSADLALIRLPEPSQYQPIQRADIRQHAMEPNELVGAYGMGAKSEGGNVHDRIQYQRMRTTRWLRDHAAKLLKEKGNFEQGYSGGPAYDDDEQRLWAGVVSRYARDPVTGVRDFYLVPAARSLSWSDATIAAIEAA